MSKHTIVNTGSPVLNDVRLLPAEEVASLYGIEISADGAVFDPTENRKFATLEKWAEYMAMLDNEDNYGSFSKISGKTYAVDDDY